MIIEGIITRDIAGAERKIPYFIDTSTGNYSQWDNDMLILGENVDLLEGLRDAACEHDLD
jgi:hypothetical protein